MAKELLETKFASAERAEIDSLMNDVENFKSLGAITFILDSLPDYILILNKERQAVFINQAFLTYLGSKPNLDLFGSRPGELLKCAHAFESDGGCGTTEFCQTCGAVTAIIHSQKGIQDIQECRIIQSGDCGALDLKVHATPLKMFGNEYTIYALTDISDVKRRKVLERIFFHDIMNTAGGVRGLAGIMKEAEEDEIKDFVDMLDQVSEKLVDEIKAQRELTAAEDSELTTTFEKFTTSFILEVIKSIYSKHLVSRERKVEIEALHDNIEINTDKTLLGRVLSNLTKNALEASPKLGVVRIGCKKVDNNIEFWVNNQLVIPRVVQLQMFQRSFSTKGPGRGIGTYSIKLLTERYLKGTVRFVSEETVGTTFYVKIPIDANA